MVRKYKGDVPMKKTVLATSIAMALGMSAGVFAQDDSAVAEGEGVAADDGSTAVGVNDSINGNNVDTTNDNEVGNTTVSDSGNDSSTNDSSTNTNITDNSSTDNSDNGKVKISNVANDNSVEQEDESISDSYKVKDSFKTSNDSSTNVNIGDIGVAVSSSTLSGSVSGVLAAPGIAGDYSVENHINQSYGGSSGITQTSQNNGIGSLTQQSTAVQSNVSLNE